MRKIVLLLLVVATAFVSCQKKEQVMPPAVIHAKVDSIVGSKMNEMNAQSLEDLDHRIAIEVKVKADSIITAETVKQSHADSLAGKFKHTDTAASPKPATTPAVPKPAAVIHK